MQLAFDNNYLTRPTFSIQSDTTINIVFCLSLSFVKLLATPVPVGGFATLRS